MAALKLCILSSEIMPYAKTGGLADVAGALCRELAARGHEVRAFMPLYASVRSAAWNLEPIAAVQGARLAMGAESYEFSLQMAQLPGTRQPIYFIDCPRMFERDSLYTNDPDEYRRFLLYTRAVIESCALLGFVPDVFHCNDWHAAFLPLLLRAAHPVGPLARVPSVLTIHNIGYQGAMPAAAVQELDLGDRQELLDPEDLLQGFINPLKTGIAYADVVTTVSPTYAREICETPLGMGMQPVLNARRDGVTGILNGVDYAEWDPRHDPHLATHFGPADLAGKLANKRRLLELAQLRLPESRPLLAVVSRLTEQKGFDLLFESLPELLRDRDCGFVALGSGDVRYVRFFERLAAEFPGRAAFRSGYDESFAHLIEAGADVFLMPSRYEPCGLNQMYSLRYGTIPIVHKTGGLADSVRHFNPGSGQGTGCVFNDFDVGAVRWAMATTLDWYEDRSVWTRLMQNAMAEDFSWGRQVVHYESVFRRLSASKA
jgi:starch synthase